MQAEITLRQAAQQALEALKIEQAALEYEHGKVEHIENAITALRAALAEPQTTHWEGCEAVHPECGAKAEIERKSDAIQRLWKERDELRALNAELVEALTTCVMAMQDYQAGIGITEMFDAGERKGRAALAKVEASK